MLEGDRVHAAAPSAHLRGADDRLGLPVPALRQHVGPAGSYQLERRVLVEPGHDLDGLESRDDGGAIREPIDGTVIAFSETLRRGVAVDCDQQRCAQRARFREIGGVSAMKDVEYAVREDQRPRAGGEPRRKLLRRADLRFEWRLHADSGYLTRW